MFGPFGVATCEEENIDVVVVMDAESSTNATTSTILPDAAKEESTTVTLPLFKKSDFLSPMYRSHTLQS